MKMIDLTREQFGRLTVISRSENRGKHLMWKVCEQVLVTAKGLAKLSGVAKKVMGLAQ